jgi:hypothetical protein
LTQTGKKILAVKIRYEVTLSRGVAVDKKCVAFCTVNTAHNLPLKYRPINALNKINMNKGVILWEI